MPLPVEVYDGNLENRIGLGTQPTGFEIDDGEMRAGRWFGWMTHGVTLGVRCDGQAVPSDENALTAGANPDGCGHGETGEMPFLFRFATPKAVLAVLAGERLAFLVHRTGAAQEAGLSFPTNAGLGTLGLGWEEKVGAAFAHCVIHPVRRGNDFEEQGLQC